MKKSIAFLAGLLTLASSAFAFSIGNRFVEVRANVPLGLSNNGISLNDIMQEEAVIDLNKIKDSVGKDGFKLNLFATPEVDLNLRFGKTGSLFFQAGVDANVNLNFTKETIELFAKGNPDGGPLSGGVNAGGDVFAFFRVPVSFKAQELELTVTPAVFIPVAYVVADDAKMTIVNGIDGTFSISGHADVAVYSAATKTLLDNPDGFTMEQIMDQAGFDLNVAGKYPVMKNLKVTGSVLCPIMPGSLVSKTSVSADFDMSKNLLDSSKDKDPDFSFSELKTVDLETPEKIFRPLELMAGVEYNLTRSILVDGALGVAIRNPFSDNSKFTMQYDAGIGINLANIIGVNARSKLKNQVYSHTAGVMLNLRLLELDAGVSLTGTSIPASFTMKGLGAYITLCVGI